MKKIISAIISATLLVAFASSVCFAQTENTITVTVDFSGERSSISEYIYGINDFADNADATAIRQGGNRYTAYNWENNASNAGSDWQHYSDRYLVSGIGSAFSKNSGATALWLSSVAKGRYTVATLQMAGYVSADVNGTVSESDTAPSARWKTVVAKKGSSFSLSPDVSDDYVYMDEYVNYLVQTLGSSTTENGIKGYMLDNEPALWPSTHPRVHPDKTTCKELVEKSVELASAIKSVDANADVYGPALYGMGAFKNLQDAPDYSSEASEYDWFVSYYLDKMSEASQQYGKRLLDVVDLHYYTEATGTCRVANCDDESHIDCVKARLQAVRTLDEEGYTENSWIGKWCKEYLPVLTKTQESIDKYYPGTKMSLSEYNFGGGDHISGGIAEADALGTFAKNGVYLATLFDDGKYQMSAIKLYTNYDGNGSSFGDTYIPSQSSDKENCTSYASVKTGNSGKANLVITNKSLDSAQKTTVNLSGTNEKYKTATVWTLNSESSEIKCTGVYNLKDNSFELTLDPLSVVQIELDSYAGTSITDEKGDVNNDGNCDIIDIVLIRSHIVGNSNLNVIDNNAVSRADVNDDKSVDIIDVVLLRNKLVSSGGKK